MKISKTSCHGYHFFAFVCLTYFPNLIDFRLWIMYFIEFKESLDNIKSFSLLIYLIIWKTEIQNRKYDFIAYALWKMHLSDAYNTL